jgi:hypothetical protein
MLVGGIWSALCKTNGQHTKTTLKLGCLRLLFSQAPPLHNSIAILC